jgi:carbamoyltransferase
MALLEVRRTATTAEARQFGLYWLPGFCLALAALTAYRGHPTGVLAMLAAIAAASLALGTLRPAWLRPVLIAWMWITYPIGWLVSHLLMAIIYFGVITPIALVMRLLGRDPLDRSADQRADSYWTARPQDVEAARYFRQF